MRNFFSADFHLGHENIIKYCNRPFKSEKEMNDTIIFNTNQRADGNDVLYHIGDFCFRGGNEGGRTKSQNWEQFILPKIIHLKGNHDENNGTKALITKAIMEFGNKVVFVTHIPPTMSAEVPDFCDFVICGHVHNEWKYLYDPNGKIKVPIINVGLDAWKFRIVEITEILALYHQIIKNA